MSTPRLTMFSCNGLCYQFQAISFNAKKEPLLFGFLMQQKDVIDLSIDFN